jgi:hypothetical protein
VDLGRGGVLEASIGAPVLPPLDWRSGEVHLEVAFEGKVRSFQFHGSFARMGSGDRCEIKIPNLGGAVSAYLQIGNGYLAIVELSTTVDLPRGEIQYLLPGGSVWLLSNARLTLESLRLEQTASEAFSWESFDMEDLRVLPNTLVLESVQSKPDSKENQFRLTSAISVLGTHAACQLQLKHRSVAPFQCVIFRGEHVGQPVRVVDLMAPIPTQVGGRTANGEVLNAGARLQCGKMVFSAKRLFYDSPSGYVSSLPGMERLKQRASEGGGLQPEIVFQDGVPAVDVPGLYTGWPNAAWLQTGGDFKNPSMVVRSFSEQSLLNPPGRNVDSHLGDGAGSGKESVGTGSVGSRRGIEAEESGAVGGADERTMPSSPTLGDGETSSGAGRDGQVLVLTATPWEESIERRQANMVAMLEALTSKIDALERSLQNSPTWLDRMPTLLEDWMSRATQASSDASAERWLSAMRSELDRRLASVPAGSTFVTEASSATQRSVGSAVETSSAMATLTDSAAVRVAASFPSAGMESSAGESNSSSTGVNEKERDATLRRSSNMSSKSGAEGSLPKDLGSFAVGRSEPPIAGGTGERLGAGSEPGQSDGRMIRGAHLSNVPSQAGARGSKKSRRREMRLKKNSPTTGGTSMDRDHEIAGHENAGQSSRVISASDRESNIDQREAHRAAAWPMPPTVGTSAPVQGPAHAKSSAMSPDAERFETKSGGQRGTVVVEADRLLAASESPEETLVLGSLMGLRQKKENVRWFRVKIAMVIGGLLMLIVAFYAWERIPEGWRNVIWDGLTSWFTGGSRASLDEPGVPR